MWDTPEAIGIASFSGCLTFQESLHTWLDLSSVPSPTPHSPTLVRGLILPTCYQHTAALSIPASLSSLSPKTCLVIKMLVMRLSPKALCSTTQPCHSPWSGTSLARLPALSCKCSHSQEECHIKSRLMETRGSDYPAKMQHGKLATASSR